MRRAKKSDQEALSQIIEHLIKLYSKPTSRSYSDIENCDVINYLNCIIH